MKRIPTLISGLAIVLLGGAPAWSSDGSGAEAWVRFWNQDGGTGTCTVFKMLRDPAGNLLVAGDQTGTNGVCSQVLWKVNPSGRELWRVEEPVVLTNEEGWRAFEVDSQGASLVTGTGGTVKYGADGSKVWETGYTGRALAVDSTDHVIVAGFSEPDWSLAKISPEGTNVWVRYEKARSPEWVVSPKAVTVNPAGEIYMAGSELANGNSVYWINREKIWKHNAVGTKIWDFDLIGGGSPWDYYLFVPHPDGGIWIGWNHIGSGDSDARVYWVQPDGSVTTRAPAWARGSTMDLDGNVYGCRIRYIELPYTNISIARVNTDGLMVWEQLFTDGGITNQIRSGNSVCLSLNRTVVVTGVAPRPETRGDILLLGYDKETGRELWVRRWNGPANGDDEGRAVVADEAGNVFVAGTSDNVEGGRDVVLLKYATLTPVAVEGDDVAVEFPAPVGATVGIQGSTNLVDWLDLGTTQADSEGVARYRDTNVLQTLPQRYYRSRRE